jgi:hypothetical protein
MLEKTKSKVEEKVTRLTDNTAKKVTRREREDVAENVREEIKTCRRRGE